ncbi:MAG: hypothetical protein HDT23_06360 [Ruminococcus sp.]|nr:hypothetical protein [Ruminococcus sp.]
MKKSLSFLISGIMSVSAVGAGVPFSNAVAESAYTVQDATNLQDFILGRITGKVFRPERRQQS